MFHINFRYLSKRAKNYSLSFELRGFFAKKIGMYAYKINVDCVDKTTISKEYDAGNGTVFLDRISWALSYLTNSGLTERPRRGVYKLTEKAKDFLDNPIELQKYVKEQIAKRTLERQTSELYVDPVDSVDSIPDQPPSNQTPHELLDTACQSIRQSTYDSSVTQATNDGGIDGIIKEGVLGLESWQ